MSGKIPERVVEEIRDRTDILGLVGKYVPLKKAGRNFVGLCPFHGEKTPSFSVNPEKGIFKCFGCGKGGNAITFLMEMEGMSFVDAVEDLGNRCGVRIEKTRPDTPKDDRTERLIALNEEARAYFTRNLKSPEAAKAVEYLKKRGLDRETALLFEIGYAGSRWDALFSYLRGKGAPAELLISSGLAIQGDRGPFDRFRNRIIFPIRDHRERLVGFGGRIVGKGEPKYMNSPETSLYHKGEVLYGLSLSRDEIRRAGQVVIVEGYMDLIALFQAGIKNVAATLGTALTADHLNVRLLSRYTREVVLLFDPDEAGIKAAERTLPLFGESEIYAKAAVIPNGDDPDDFVRKNGAEAFRAIIAGAVDIFEFVLDRISERHDLQTAKGQSLALEEAAAVAAMKRSGVDRDFYNGRIAQRLAVTELSVKNAVEAAVKHQRTRFHDTPHSESPAAPFNPSAAEARLFKIAVNFPNALVASGFTTAHSTLFVESLLADFILDVSGIGRDHDPVPLSAILGELDNPSLRNAVAGLAFIDEGEIADEKEAIEIAGDCIRVLEHTGIKKKMREINRQLSEDSSDEAITELLIKKMDYKNKLKR